MPGINLFQNYLVEFAPETRIEFSPVSSSLKGANNAKLSCFRSQGWQNAYLSFFKSGIEIAAYDEVSDLMLNAFAPC